MQKLQLERKYLLCELSPMQTGPCPVQLCTYNFIENNNLVLRNNRRSPEGYMMRHLKQKHNIADNEARRNMLIPHTLWLWLSADKIVLLLECVAIYLNANFDVSTITRDAIDIAHGIIIDFCSLIQCKLNYCMLGGGCCCCWSLIFICKVGFYGSVSVEREK